MRLKSTIKLSNTSDEATARTMVSSWYLIGLLADFAYQNTLKCEMTTAITGYTVLLIRQYFNAEQSPLRSPLV